VQLTKPGAASDETDTGTCECTHKNHFFALGVEDLTVQIEHLWQTTFAHGSFPETRVKKDGGEGYKVSAVPYIQLPLSLRPCCVRVRLTLTPGPSISGAARLCVGSP